MSDQAMLMRSSNDYSGDGLPWKRPKKVLKAVCFKEVTPVKITKLIRNFAVV